MVGFAQSEHIIFYIHIQVKGTILILIPIILQSINITLYILYKISR